MTRTAARVVVFVEGQLGGELGQMDGRDLDVVLLVVGRVGAEEETVHGVVLVGRTATRELVQDKSPVRFEIRQPLRGEGGPVEGVGDDEVVQEGRVLLPYLVLLVDLLVQRSRLVVRRSHVTRVGAKSGT